MRINELTEGVEYATCTGELVVPIAPLSNKYRYLRRCTKGGEVEKAEWSEPFIGLAPEEAKPVPTDPWGGCHRQGRAVGVLKVEKGTVTTVNHYPQVGDTQGVYCRRYDFDREGNRQGEGVEILVPARDIKGTWTDYLVLYAAVVEQKYDLRIGAEKEKARQIEVAQRWGAIAAALDLPTHREGQRPTSTTWYDFDLGSRSSRHNGGVSWELEFRGDDDAALETALTTLERALKIKKGKR